MPSPARCRSPLPSPVLAYRSPSRSRIDAWGVSHAGRVWPPPWLGAMIDMLDEPSDSLPRRSRRAVGWMRDPTCLGATAGWDDALRRADADGRGGGARARAGPRAD